MSAPSFLAEKHSCSDTRQLTFCDQAPSASLEELRPSLAPRRSLARPAIEKTGLVIENALILSCTIVHGYIKKGANTVRIGFLDHHLANYHADVFHSIITSRYGPETSVALAYELAPRGTDDWCAARGILRASSMEQVIEQADALMVLAPDNFEVHSQLALPALASGKPVFVDKFLAPTLREARTIVEAARRHGTPLMSASALRYAPEIEDLAAGLDGPPETVFARGMGHWDGYGVHTVSMLWRVLDVGPLHRVCDIGIEGVSFVALDFGTLRATAEVRAAENQFETCPWQLGVRLAGRYRIATVAASEAFYAHLIRAIIDFFRTGNSPVSHREMLDTVAVLEGASRSRREGGRWVSPEELA